VPFDDIVDALERVYANEVFREDARDVQGRLEELQTGMRRWVEFAYEEKQCVPSILPCEEEAGLMRGCRADLDSLPRDNDLQPFISMLVWLTNETKRYQKLFPSPVVEYAQPTLPPSYEC
jgi:hypothetical protein